MNSPLNPGYFSRDELINMGFSSVGENTLVSKLCNVVAPENIALGKDVRIDAFTSLVASGGRIEIGRNVHIGTGCMLGGRGGIYMAAFSGLSHQVQIYTASDDYSGRHMTNPTVPARFTGGKVAAVRIGRHAIIGAGVVILPGGNVGEGAAVGALSMVNRPVPDWEIHTGIPAERRAARRQDLLKLERRLLDEEEQ